MSTFKKVQAVIMDVLEVDADGITPETFVMRDLPTESIDLMEYGVGLTKECGVSVNDEVVFLKSLRIHLAEAEEKNTDTVAHLKGVYPHLTEGRIRQILDEVTEGPVLQVKDIVAYIDHAKRA